MSKGFYLFEENALVPFNLHTLPSILFGGTKITEAKEFKFFLIDKRGNKSIEVLSLSLSINRYE